MTSVTWAEKQVTYSILNANLTLFSHTHSWLRNIINGVAVLMVDNPLWFDNILAVFLGDLLMYGFNAI